MDSSVLTSAYSVYKFEFHIGDVVYYKTDPEQNPCLVTGILLRKDGHIFEVSMGTEATYSQAFELTNVQGEATEDLL